MGNERNIVTVKKVANQTPKKQHNANAINEKKYDEKNETRKMNQLRIRCSNLFQSKQTHTQPHAYIKQNNCKTKEVKCVCMC